MKMEEGLINIFLDYATPKFSAGQGLADGSEERPIQLIGGGKICLQKC
jgi:hypothetical protein